MKHGVTRTLWVWAVVALLVASGHVALSRADGEDPALKPGKTDAPAGLSQTPREAITIASPILMVWRDSVTGKTHSRTLPLETKATIAADPDDDSGNLLVTMPLQADTRTVVALK